MPHQIKPLYRKVNTKARGHGHSVGGDFRHERHRKGLDADDALRGRMRGRDDRGLDYTPLFRFLLASVGRPWADVHREAAARLDREAPIFWLVALADEDREDVVRVGESSYYSGLCVDAAGLLQVVNPAVTVETMTPRCRCCTHTLNGVRFGPPARPPGE
jgi:hypothetical protein